MIRVHVTSAMTCSGIPQLWTHLSLQYHSKTDAYYILPCNTLLCIHIFIWYYGIAQHLANTTALNNLYSRNIHSKYLIMMCMSYFLVMIDKRRNYSYENVLYILSFVWLSFCIIKVLFDRNILSNPMQYLIHNSFSTYPAVIRKPIFGVYIHVYVLFVNYI